MAVTFKKGILDGDTVILVHNTAVTVTPTAADTLDPSFVTAVIVALPTAIPVTKPVLDTVAIDGVSEVYVTVLSVAFAGNTVGVNC